MTSLYDSIKGNYEELSNSFDDIKSFRDGYDIVSVGDYSWIIGNDGKNVIDMKTFNNIGEISTTEEEKFIFSTEEKGSYKYYDSHLYERLIPTEKYEYLGTFHNGYALVEKNGKWGYIDEDFKEHDVKYEAATSFNNEVAVVKKDGKWAIINDELEIKTKFEFDSVVLDDYGTCGTNNRIFLEKDGKYYMYNRKGEKVSGAYEDAKNFATIDGYAAICQDGKWGLIDKEGETVLKCSYDELESSSLGFSAYKDNDKWGYITDSGEIMIEPSFDEAKAFNELGCAPVRKGSAWIIIRLTILENE